MLQAQLRQQQPPVAAADPPSSSALDVGGTAAGPGAGFGGGGFGCGDYTGVGVGEELSAKTRADALRVESLLATRTNEYVVG